MKNRIISVIAMLMCCIMLTGSVAVGGNGFAQVFTLRASAESEVTYQTGDIIEYGTYPQSEVKDEELSAALNSLGGEWVSYGYYSGTGVYCDGLMVPSDYTRYKDVIYNGNKYRAVTFSSYRPRFTGYVCSQAESRQYDHGYKTGKIYWFKYEPVKWRVLDPSTGFIMCDTAIDSQPYSNIIFWNDINESGYVDRNEIFGDADYTYYAANYANSSIREWLNNDFYNTAFSNTEKENILTTELDNKTSDSADNLRDKVFLLSYDEARNSSYGFSSEFSEYDTARRLQCTDYAKCQGCDLSQEDSYLNNCLWWLRSADSSYFVRYPLFWGYIYGDTGANHTDYGVVPAVKLKNLKEDVSMDPFASSNGDATHSTYDENGNVVSTENCIYSSERTEADCLNDGEVIYTCIKCNYTYSETLYSTGHKGVSAKNAVAATCIREGRESDTICSVCGVTVTVGKTTEKTGHNPSGPVRENETDSYCDIHGTYDLVVYCAVCEKEIIRFTMEKELAEHTPGNAVKENSKPATCTENGSFDEVVYCSVCKAEISRTEKTVPAAGHKDTNKDGCCDVCKKITDADLANPCGNAKINVASEKTVDYRSNVTITATATGVPSGYYLAIYVDGKQVAKGTNTEVSYSAGELKNDLDYTVKVIDAKGNVQKDASGKDLAKDGGHITCNNGFFKMIIAFFRALFKKLPTVTIKP